MAPAPASAPGTALISGASGGLGAGVTERFLSDGWRVVAPSHSSRDVEIVRERHGDAGASLEIPQADLMDAASVTAAVKVATASPEAPLRAVVNLVGGFSAPGRVHETPVEEFESQLRLNLRPTYLLCAASLPALRDADGAIVCVSTRAAVRPFPGAAGYIASKAAVLAFIDALAAEYTQDGVRANAVLPSVIDTPGNRAAQPDADHSRWVTPAQIADVIAFLCSERAGPVSGAHVPVYGRA
jgi:NAD(P)-dependent dehydrogenase (short-subunit alcohol dehydrogenase family)